MQQRLLLPLHLLIFNVFKGKVLIDLKVLTISSKILISLFLTILLTSSPPLLIIHLRAAIYFSAPFLNHEVVDFNDLLFVVLHQMILESLFKQFLALNVRFAPFIKEEEV